MSDMMSDMMSVENPSFLASFRIQDGELKYDDDDDNDDDDDCASLLH